MRGSSAGWSTSSGPITRPHNASVVAQLAERFPASHRLQTGSSAGVNERRKRASTSMPTDFVSRYGSRMSASANRTASSIDQVSRFTEWTSRASARMQAVPTL
jgi:hypothetical protein